ncbi:MAG: efflux RND transporter periplasmic adaptor subunit [Planctomycetes bacterium]|nr:efflux RND transporter periplasmic adaptor subunit [Planctomycetota bacterium]
MSRSNARSLLALAALVAVPGCLEKDRPESETAPVPVTVIRLDNMTPPRTVRLTGRAEPYREERIGFEVAGRIEYGLDEGALAQGTVFDAEGLEVEKGTVLAQIGASRYREALESVEAQLATARAKLAAQEVERADVLTADLALAEARLAAETSQVAASEAAEAGLVADRDLAAKLLDRLRRLGGDVSREELDTTQARLASAEASLAKARAELSGRRRLLSAREAERLQAQGTIRAKEAEVKSTEARIAEIEVSVRKAELDLERCSLHAPFSGRVTQVHAVHGAYVSAGQAVLTLTLLDPIQVTVSVSAGDEREVHLGDLAVLHLAEVGGRGDLPAWVMDKSEVAEPATRTFRIGLLARNERRGQGAGGLPPFEDFVPVVTRYVGAPGPLFVQAGCLLEEGGKFYVLRVPRKELEIESTDPRSLSFVPEKIEVVPGAVRVPFLSWTFVELARSDGLAEDDMVLFAPRRELAAGVSWPGREWTIRPGDRIPLSLAMGQGKTGIYVPAQAIRVGAHGETSVFVAEEGKAREVPVTAGEDRGELRRIEGPGIDPGALLVLEGVHRIEDGDPVVVVEHPAPAGREGDR